MVKVRSLESILFQDIFVFVMYYVYVMSGPSLLLESTDSMIIKTQPFLYKSGLAPNNITLSRNSVESY